MEDNKSNIIWLLIALTGIGFTFWYQEKETHYQNTIKQLESQQISCQAELKGFKDGIMYGRNK